MFLAISISSANADTTKKENSMATAELEPMKCFTYTSNQGYKALIKINGKTIVDWKSPSGLKIFDENNAFKQVAEDIPELGKEMAFVLKEGENTIDVEYKEDGFSQGDFWFSFASMRYKVPFFFFSGEGEQGKVSSKFIINNEEPTGYNTTVGNKDAAFVYFSDRINFFQATLNDKKLMSFGNSNGLTNLNLNDGDNKLEIRYLSEYEGVFSYYIKTPGFTKLIEKTITTNDLNKEVVDVYSIKQ